MSIISFTNSIKFRLIRLIESNPYLNLLIYNNISIFKPFLPHEKDYYGIKHLINNEVNDSIIDVGGNLGISAMGFRKLGLNNKIFLFEPNKYIFKNYIKNKIIKNYKNIIGFNYALEKKKSQKISFIHTIKKSVFIIFVVLIKNILKIVLIFHLKEKKLK